MIVPESTAPLGTWQAGDSSLIIEYSLASMEDIRAQAVSGFHSFRHGGLETGGVLYGSVEGDIVRVLGSAELACEHALGPGFVLSAKDRAVFEKLLEAPPGLEAVGWYASHTRSGLEIGANDLDIFDSFFTRPGAVALIVQPEKLGPAKAAFFYRGPAGEIRSSRADDWFLIDAAPRRRAVQALEPPPAVDAAPVEPQPEPPVEPQASDDQWGGPLFAPPPPFLQQSAVDEAGSAPGDPEWMPAKRRRRKWLWATAGVIAVVGALIPFVRPAIRRAPPRLDLQAHEISAGQVRIEWNRGLAAMLGASSGVLEIGDGASHLNVPLNAEQLRSSSITYAHQSPRVSVRLRVQPERGRGAPLEEGLAYLGKTAPLPAAEPVPAEPAGSATPPPERTAAIATDRAPAGKREPRIAEPRSAERAAENPPPQAAPPRRLAVIPAAGPSSQTRPAAAIPSPPPVIAGAAAPAPALSLPAHLPAPAPPPRTQVYAGPRSGRLIWTGSLTRRGVVEIEGSHASVGALAGALPGVPVSIRVLPAEFASDGLIVYTADASRNGRAEPAGAANGWNRTRFEWDAQRAREIAVLEAPNPSNQFKRLALRNDARNCAVLVIEWNVQ